MSRTSIRNVGIAALAASSGVGLLGMSGAAAALAPAHKTSPVSPSVVLVGETKAELLSTAKSTATSTATSSTHHKRRTPRQLGRDMAKARGWGAGQFRCLDSLWTNESGWRVHAHNGSGAYGIPQALPGPKMATAGANWRNSAKTQIRWGLRYIKNRHRTPCLAWHYWRSHGWY
ncbi:MAG TPA: lytic transglycosylase domain-containing protein [Actinomycetes bacterium]|nr:lytic transglycosylase domain-containing protein [Actinomycetes bacterium]